MAMKKRKIGTTTYTDTIPNPKGTHGKTLVSSPTAVTALAARHAKRKHIAAAKAAEGAKPRTKEGKALLAEVPKAQEAASAAKRSFVAARKAIRKGPVAKAGFKIGKRGGKYIEVDGKKHYMK